MDGENNGKPYEQMDDLVVFPYFWKHPNAQKLTQMNYDESNEGLFFPWFFPTIKNMEFLVQVFCHPIFCMNPHEGGD